MPDERPVLDQVNLVARDVAAMLAFYEQLGVEIPPGEAPWDQHHVTLERGERLHLDVDSSAFASQWNRGWSAGSGGVLIGFRLATRAAVDETYEALTAAGHQGQQPPYDAFWGARYAVVTDPDGNAVGLMSPVDEAERGEAPEPGSGVHADGAAP